MGPGTVEMEPLIAREFAGLVPRATTFFSGALGGIAASPVCDFVVVCRRVEAGRGETGF